VFLSVVVGVVPFIGNGFLLWASLFTLLYGLIMIVSALNTLGPTNLTPFPEPTLKNELVSNGVYGAVRHPMCKHFVDVQQNTNEHVNELLLPLVAQMVAWF
jgi:protein-S-isoprenylcysteine O-methyltransferase Ste14